MKKKIFVVSLIIVFIVNILSVYGFAADNNYSFNVSLTANNSKVAAGSEVSVTVKLSNLNVGSNGINGFTAYLSYDTDVFENLTDSSVDGLNGWVPSYTPGTGKVSLYRTTFLKNDEEIMQISLKTKSTVPNNKQGEVKLSTIIVSNSSDEISSQNVSTNITVTNDNADSVIEPTRSDTSITPTALNTTISLLPTNVANNTTSTGSSSGSSSSGSSSGTSSSVVPAPDGSSQIIAAPTMTLAGNNTNTNSSSGLIGSNSIQTTGANSNQVANSSQTDIPYTGTDSSALAKIIIGFVFIGLAMYIKIEKMNKDIR